MRTLSSIVVLAVVALVGCGDKGPSGQAAPEEAAPEDDVRAVVVRFGAASAKKDYQQICDELLAQSLVKNVEQYGLPCELALKQGLGEVSSPELAVEAVTVKGDRASARVRTTAAGQQPSTDTLALRRAGDQWRIVALS